MTEASAKRRTPWATVEPAPYRSETDRDLPTDQQPTTEHDLHLLPTWRARLERLEAGSGRDGGADPHHPAGAGLLCREAHPRGGPGRGRGDARLRAPAADRVHRHRLRVPVQPPRRPDPEKSPRGSVLVRPDLDRPAAHGGRAGRDPARRPGRALSVRGRPAAPRGPRPAGRPDPAADPVHRPLHPGGAVLPLEAGPAHPGHGLGYLHGGACLPAGPPSCALQEGEDRGRGRTGSPEGGDRGGRRVLLRARRDVPAAGSPLRLRRRQGPIAAVLPGSRGRPAVLVRAAGLRGGRRRGGRPALSDPGAGWPSPRTPTATSSRWRCPGPSPTPR